MLETGRTLAHFRIIKRLGAGGMGEVYQARDTRLDRCRPAVATGRRQPAKVHGPIASPAPSPAAADLCGCPRARRARGMSRRACAFLGVRTSGYLAGAG